MIDAIAALVAILVALGTFSAWRAEQLRRGEVLEWGLHVIAELQTLHLRCDAQVRGGPQNDRTTEHAERVSILIEQGRLFFKNASPKAHGKDKEFAYRGFRPVILDQLVFAYLIASQWPLLSPPDKEAGTVIITRCKERFVSLLQREVGRKRAADRYNIEGGNGHGLHSLLAMARANELPALPAENSSIVARAKRALRF